MIGETLIGILFLLMGTLSLIYNKRAAQEYAETWGKRLTHGYAIGRFVSVFGGLFLLLVGMLFLFVKRH
jgi:ABC-type nickel/cobalt efflux system permease component RcnA